MVQSPHLWLSCRPPKLVYTTRCNCFTVKPHCSGSHISLLVYKCEQAISVAANSVSISHYDYLLLHNLILLCPLLLAFVHNSVHHIHHFCRDAIAAKSVYVSHYDYLLLYTFLFAPFFLLLSTTAYTASTMVELAGVEDSFGVLVFVFLLHTTVLSATS